MVGDLWVFVMIEWLDVLVSGDIEDLGQKWKSKKFVEMEELRKNNYIYELIKWL